VRMLVGYVTIEPDWVTVKVGGFPVAMGPAVADPTAGVLAVAPPRLIRRLWIGLERGLRS